MKSNKIIKWLYGLFMFVPFLAIGVKSMYVTFNKNAKDSYYGENINEVQYSSADGKVELNKIYYLYVSSYTSLIDSNKNFPISNIRDFTTNDSGVLTNYNTYKDSINNIQIANNGTTNMYVSFRQDTNTLFNVGVHNKQMSFYFNADNDTTLTSQYNDFIKLATFNKDSYLDNAFYYAIDEFNNIGFDKINFVSWFDFLYNNTNVYTTFINCYVNYMLFVSLAFFIPRVLYWFINFAYSLTDSFSSKSNGGGW